MKLLASMLKELRILARDRAGLATLFVMPVALVLIVTLVQEDAYRVFGGGSAQLLVADLDQSESSRDLQAMLADTGLVAIESSLDGRPLTVDRLRMVIGEGGRRVGLVIPRGFGTRLRERAEESLAALVTGNAAPPGGEKPAITLVFDPVLPEGYRGSVSNVLERVLQGLETRVVFERLGEALGPAARGLPAGDASWRPGEGVEVRREYAAGASFTATPTPAQQNVPAWTLFAMFMIVIPLAGSIVREREGGTLLRLRTLPVSTATILAGKVLTALVVCLAQFLFLLAVGTWLLPALGTAGLEPGGRLGALLLTALAAGLAASGFGILTGTLVRSADQASFFGAAIVVIAAALGGIMVPVFAMPPGFQTAAAWSPLNWGLTAFLTVLLRGGGIEAILPQLWRLLLFFGVTMALAVALTRRREDPR